MVHAPARTRLAVVAAAALLALAFAFGAQAGLSRTMLAAGILGVPALLAGVYLIWVTPPHYLFTAALLLTPFDGSWPQMHVPGALSPDRILLAFGALSVMVRGTGARHRPALQLSGAHWLLAGVSVYAIASAFVAGTLTQKVPGLKLLEAFGIFPFLAFALAPVVFPTARERSTLLKGLVALGAYLSLTTLFEMAGPKSLVFPRYILDPHYGIHYGRGRGPFVDAVANGFALYACAVACVIAVYLWRSRAWRIFAAAIAALCAVGTVLTLERSVWIGTVVASLVLVLVVPAARRIGVPLILAGAVLVGGALVLVPGLDAKAGARASDQLSVWDRENLERTALNMIWARPLFGFGWGRYQQVDTPYFQQSPEYPLVGTNADLSNYVLGYAEELGLVGVTLWIVALLIGVGGALVVRGPPDLEPWRAGLLAIFIFFAIMESFVPPTVFANLTLWMWAGVVWSARYRPASAPSRSSLSAAALSPSPRSI